MEIRFTPTCELRKDGFIPFFNMDGKSFLPEFGKVIKTGVEVEPYTGPTTITPSDQVQTFETKRKYLLTNIKVNAVPVGSATTPATNITPVINGAAITADGDLAVSISGSASIAPTVVEGYVSSGTAGTVTANATKTVDAFVTVRDNTDLTVSGPTVTAPAGYYPEAASASVASGTAGTPTASAGRVSNHSVDVYPQVTNTTGYIIGSSKLGAPITITAADLASGTKNITANGTNIDVVGYEYVDVAVPGSTVTLETVSKSYTPTESTQTETITASTGYDAIGEVDVTINPIPTNYGLITWNGSVLTVS